MAGNDAIRNLQRWLNSRGAQLGVDGVMGPKTRAAIKAFEQQAGLPPTGEISNQLIAALTGPQPKPNLRPAPVDLGATGNTSMTPRLRQDAVRGSIEYPPQLAAGAPNFGPQAEPLASIGRPPVPDMQGVPAEWTEFPTGPRDYGAYHQPYRPGFAPMLRADLGMGPETQGPKSPNILISGPDAAAPQVPPNVTDDQKAAAITQVRDALMRMQQPQPAPAPAFQPTPGNPGFGFPGMPVRPDFGTAANDVLQELFGVKPAYGGMGSIFGTGQ